MQNLKTVFGRMFGLDYRSLALLRIGVGITILCDLAERATSLYAHYSDRGILPRADYLEKWYNKWYISLHMAGGTAGFEAFLFVLAGIFAIMLILGYRTTLAMAVSWFLLISLHNRNPLVLQGGDVVFRVVLFWMMFLPLGARWSLDRLLNRTPRPDGKIFFGVETIAYMVQVGLFYFMAGFLKTGEAWHNGTAVYYALSVDQLTRHLGIWLQSQHTITHVLTLVTKYIELYAPFLFFFPILSGPLRTLAILLFAGIQIGFNTTMHLGFFGMISIVITLGILPSWFWDTIVITVRTWFEKRARTGLSIYYDYDCTFCAKMTNIIRKVLMLAPTTIIAPSSTDKKLEDEMLAHNSWIVIDKDGTHHYGFGGIATVLAYSPFFAPLAFFARLPIVSHIGEFFYRRVANSRTLVCQPEQPPKQRTFAQKTSYGVRSVLLGYLLVYIILWNIDTIGNRNFIKPHGEWIGWLTRLDQKFDMFAPTPLTEDGWYVFPGTLRDGTETDVFRDGVYAKNPPTLSYDRPEYISALYKNQRWQKYLMNLWSKNYTAYRELYGKYICREWNASHPDEQALMSFKMTFMLEKTPPEGRPLPVAEPMTIWDHHCF